MTYLFIIGNYIEPRSQPQSKVVELDENHPIIKNLQHETAKAKEEALRARQGEPRAHH